MPVISRVISAGANARIGYVHVWSYASGKYQAALEELIAEGANPRLGDGAETPLHAAARRGPLAMVEALLSDLEPEARQRITAAYPKYPNQAACIQLGGDFAFSSAAWQIAEAHGRHAPTYLYRYDYAPRTLQWSGFGATHATELFAVFDIYRTRFGALLTAAADQRAALRVSNEVQRRWRQFSRTGVPGDDWPAYTHAERAVMVIDRKSRVEFDPQKDRRLAWDGFSLAR